MRNRMICALLCVLIIFMLTGCQLAKPLETQNSDRLIGIFITEDYINTDEKVFAVRDGENYSFPEVEGYSCFVPKVIDEAGEYEMLTGNDGISAKNYRINVTDEGEEISMDCTLYTVSDGMRRVYYVNTVYQSGEGIYLLKGDGISMDVTPGVAFSTEISETGTQTLDGKTESYSCTAGVTVECVVRPESVAMVQMDKNNSAISREEYSAEDVPDEITAASDCEYIIIEKTDAEGNTVRELLERKDESFNTLSAMPSGVCLEKTTAVNWLI